MSDSNLTIQVSISASAEIAEILMAELAGIGFDIFEENAGGIDAYCVQELFDEDQMIAIFEQYQGIGPFTYTLQTIEKQNWNEVWETNYEPIRISDKVFIRASFHDAEPGYQLELIINPKMSFGTGHHETTSLMVENLFAIDLKGKSVLDAGTGTGILAFVAKKLGASQVRGFDIDQWSVENSIENAALNHCEDIPFVQGTIRDEDSSSYDVLIANINRNILLDEMNEYAARLKSGGFLLLSGFYTQDVPALEKKAAASGIVKVSQLEKNNWVSMLLKKQ
ncbi:MAG: Ribosomal protein methyltransferase [Bacteroidota bacterium]|jgi:ribosomal protein L11 methyltransferase